MAGIDNRRAEGHIEAALALSQLESLEAPCRSCAWWMAYTLVILANGTRDQHDELSHVFTRRICAHKGPVAESAPEPPL